MKNLIRQSAILMLLFVTSMFAFGQPYTIPEIPVPDDYGSKIYIDPDYTGTESGTIEEPYNSWDDVTLAANTAYLIKAGTELSDNIEFITISNVYIGRYGEGVNPIITYRIKITVDSVTVNGLDIEYSRSSSVPIIWYEGDNVTVANCRLQGDITSEGTYTNRGLVGSGKNFVLYHCEVCYTDDDGYYGGTLQNCKFVSNYFHHNNMENDVRYGGVMTGTGDGIQFEGAYADNAYIANNFIDRKDSYWKFALIFNSGLSKTSNAVCEWNTFVSPLVGSGGLGVRWLAGTDNTFTKNLMNTNDGITGIGSASPLHLNQDYPYGVRDNHEFGPGKDCAGCTSDDNLDFASEAAYEAYLSANNLERYGSDLDTSNFWGVDEDTNWCVYNPIVVSSVDIVDDVNSAGVGSIDISVSGGNGTLYYSWSNSSVTEDISGLTEGEYEVTISDDKSCSTSRTYTVDNETTVVDDEEDDSYYLSLDTVYTSSDDDVNIGMNMIDGDEDTRWSCSDDSAVAIIPLDGVYEIDTVKISFYRGDERNTYIDIFGSLDGLNWFEMYSGSSSGLTTVLESFPVGGLVCSYIAIIGYGNNQAYSREWTSINEVKVVGNIYIDIDDVELIESDTFRVNFNTDEATAYIVDGYYDLWASPEDTYVYLDPDNSEVRIARIDGTVRTSTEEVITSSYVNDTVVWSYHRMYEGEESVYSVEGLKPNSIYKFNFYGIRHIAASESDYLFNDRKDTVSFQAQDLDSIVDVVLLSGADSVIEFVVAGIGGLSVINALEIIEYDIVPSDTSDTDVTEPCSVYKQVFVKDEDGVGIDLGDTDLYIKEE